MDYRDLFSDFGLRCTELLTAPFDAYDPPSSGFMFAREHTDIPTTWSTTNFLRSDELTIGAPNWVIAVVTAVLPAFATLRYFNRRRGRRLGLCPKCGYDLRATPDRCPECGKVLTKNDLAERQTAVGE